MRNEEREREGEGKTVYKSNLGEVDPSSIPSRYGSWHRKAESMVLDRKHRRTPTYRALIFSRCVYPSWVFNFLFLTWPFPPHHAPSYLCIYIYICLSSRTSLSSRQGERKNKAGRRSPRYTVDEFVCTRERTNIRSRWSFGVKKEGETGATRLSFKRKHRCV